MQYHAIRLLDQLRSPEHLKVKPKHVKLQGTKKTLILTPTHALSIIGITLGIVIFFAYAGTTLYIILEETRPVYTYSIVIGASIAVLVFYLISQLPFSMILSIILTTITAVIVNHYIEFINVPIPYITLAGLGCVLTLAMYQYRVYKKKLDIWNRRTQDKKRFGQPSDNLLPIIGKHKDRDDLVRKYQAEENTNTIIRMLEDKGQFYQFYGLPAAYGEDRTIDGVLLAGKNLLILRSIMVHNGTVRLQKGLENPPLNSADNDWAHNVKFLYSRLFPRLRVSVWFIVQPAEKPHEGRGVTITPSSDKDINLIMVPEIHKLESSLFHSSLPVLRTHRSDIISLNSMRIGDHHSLRETQEDSYFTHTF